MVDVAIVVLEPKLKLERSKEPPEAMFGEFEGENLKVALSSFGTEKLVGIVPDVEEKLNVDLGIVAMEGGEVVEESLSLLKLFVIVNVLVGASTIDLGESTDFWPPIDSDMLFGGEKAFFDGSTVVLN